MGKDWWVVGLGVKHQLDQNSFGSRSNLRKKGLFLAQGFRGFRFVMLEKAWPGSIVWSCSHGSRPASREDRNARSR